MKATAAKEGVSTCFNKRIWTDGGHWRILFRELFGNDDRYRDLREKIDLLWPGYRERQIDTRGTVMLYSCLKNRENPRKMILVGNSHFYFHPKAGALRTLQAYALVREGLEIRRKILQASSGDQVDLIFCGDFNADAGSGAISILTDGRVERTHEIWQSGKRAVINR